VVDHFSGQRTIGAQISAGAVPTIYARVGDVFAWLCVVALDVLLAMALLVRP